METKQVVVQKERPEEESDWKSKLVLPPRDARFRTADVTSTKNQEW